MKILKGALVVIKGKKVGNLYVLLGNTVTGGTAVFTSIDGDSDLTQLWHMCLGHMGDRGLAYTSGSFSLGSTHAS